MTAAAFNPATDCRGLCRDAPTCVGRRLCLSRAEVRPGIKLHFDAEQAQHLETVLEAAGATLEPTSAFERDALVTAAALSERLGRYLETEHLLAVRQAWLASAESFSAAWKEPPGRMNARRDPGDAAETRELERYDDTLEANAEEPES